MSIKCIALDLDRTTLNIDGKLSKENKTALEYAISRGVHIVVASGRAFHTLPEDVVQISGIEYAITSNGTAVYHIPTQKCLHQYKLASNNIKEIIQLSKSEKVTYEAFIDGKAYADSTYIDHPEIFGANAQAITYIRETRNMVENIEQFINEHIEEIDCMDIITKDNQLKKTLMKQLKNEVEGIYITSSIEQLIEISNKQAGKHSGVKLIMELLKLEQEEIAAFGDGDNDIDMLKFVGTGIAVENASSQCKSAADRITKHHNENGVAYGIYEILKI